MVLGRTHACTTQLIGARVSRRHVELSRGTHGWLARDLGSKNGTSLNGARITEAPLSPQDVLRVGEWVGVVADVLPEQEPIRWIAPGLLGAAALASCFAALTAVAPSDLDVVLTGETGTGKEVLARAVHELSGRRGELVAVNCAALPQHLAEGELFGYRKGAFTSAVRSSVGHLRSAQGGTLFLDEVVELDERVQAKLLRALETRTVVPLGESTPEAVDLRVVAAAQTALVDRVEAGKFRADLYARLNGVEVHIPPVRKRREEVIAHFRRELSVRCGGAGPDLDADLAEQLCLYDWPLNVREIRQLAARMAVLHGAEALLTRAHLPERIAGWRTRDSKRPPEPRRERAARSPSRAARRLDANERRNRNDLESLVRALRQVGGNVSAAAKAIGMSRQRAYRLMDQHPELGVCDLAPSESEVS